MMATNTMYDAPIDAPDFADSTHESAFGMGGGDTLRDKSAGLRDQATAKLRGFADDGKHQVANSLDGLVTAARVGATGAGSLSARTAKAVPGNQTRTPISSSMARWRSSSCNAMVFSAPVPGS